MTHEEAVLEIPEFDQGRSDEKVRAALAMHRASCEECRAMSEAFGVVAASLRRAGPHPASPLIVAYAVDPESLAEEETSTISSHLRACRACLREVEVTRETDAATTSRVLPFPAGLLRARPGGWSPGVRVAVAAALAAAVLGYPAYLGTIRLPRIMKEAEDLRAARDAAGREIQGLRSALGDSQERLRRQAAWTGPVDLHVLESATRSWGSVTTFTVHPAQSYVVISLLPPVPARAQTRDLFRFEIVGAEGRIAWAADLTAGEIRRRLESSGAIAFAVPAAAVPPARYTMRFLRQGAPPAEALLRAEFEIALRGD